MWPAEGRHRVHGFSRTLHQTISFGLPLRPSDFVRCGQCTKVRQGSTGANGRLTLWRPFGRPEERACSRQGALGPGMLDMAC